MISRAIAVLSASCVLAIMALVLVVLSIGLCVAR